MTHTPRFRVLAFALAFNLAVAPLLSAAAPTKPARPNVVLIMPDDISYGDFSLYNPAKLRTPQIDRLGRESVRFTDFHVSPTCSPTRAALLTGRYNNATGVWHTLVGRNHLRRDEITLAEIFRANGYRTALSGKWHLGPSHPFRPQDRGFDYVATHSDGGISQQHDAWGNGYLPPSRFPVNGVLTDLTDEDDGIPGAFASNFFTSRAIEWMRERAGQREPFFLYLTYFAAHDPLQKPSDARPGIGVREAVIENLDKNVGRVLAFLETSGLADDTLLIFLTDNGHRGYFRGHKGSEFEGGHRVPFFVRWKNGGLAGSEATAREVATLAAHIDVVPTLMALIGLKDVASRPATVPLHGRSLATLLDPAPRNDDPALRERILIVDNQRNHDLVKYKQAAVMQDEAAAADRLPRKWRLVREAASKGWTLFDVESDRMQEKNLAADPAHAAVVTRLSEAYERWWLEVSARGAELARTILGSAAQPEICLYAHDWHTTAEVSIFNIPWNQNLVAKAPVQNGYHAVEFARPGRYRIELRRWPEDIAAETTLTSALAKPLWFQNERGRALPIHSARLRMWNGEDVLADLRQAVDAEADAAVFTIDKASAGPAFIEATFYDAADAMLCGAYYVYVRPEVGR